MADVYAKKNQHDLAEKSFREALKQREELANTLTQKTYAELIQADVVQSRMYLGDFLLMIRRRPEEARPEYQACLDLLTTLIKNNPDSLDIQQRLGATYYRLGIIEKEPSKSKELFEKSLAYRAALAKLDPKDMTNQVEYLLALARLRKYDEVESLAERVLQQAGRDPQSLFQTACGFAILAQTKDPKRPDYRSKSLEVIRRLLKAGWKDPVWLQCDPDFEYLHNDPEFQRLVRDSNRP